MSRAPLAFALGVLPVLALASEPTRLSVLETGATANDRDVDTVAIQGAIDRLASSGGGTVVVPPGVFVSGALDFRPGVHLHLEKDAVLRAVSTDIATHFPARPTRIEGRLREFTPALINADRCDGFRLTGEGVLDGDGRPVWNEFWRLRKAAPDPRNFPNLSLPRARLAHISDSRDILVEGVTFKDSQFWNLHLYRCQNVVVRRARFVVPDDYGQAPSTDAIDVDSSQDVLVEGCFFSVTDDGVAMKGTKGPLALEDKASPPVERVTVRDCEFRRAHAALTFGSEATIVRDVVLEHSRVTGPMSVLNLKLRTDTPQTYENITVRHLTLDARRGALISVAPWAQYADLEGLPPPRSVVRNVVVSDITGRYGSFGEIGGNTGRTTLDGFLLKNIDLRLAEDRLQTRDVENLRAENVLINGAPSAAALTYSPAK